MIFAIWLVGAVATYLLFPLLFAHISLFYFNNIADSRPTKETLDYLIGHKSGSDRFVQIVYSFVWFGAIGFYIGAWIVLLIRFWHKKLFKNKLGLTDPSNALLNAYLKRKL